MFYPQLAGVTKRRKAYQTSHFLPKGEETREYTLIILLLEPRASSPCTASSLRSTSSRAGSVLGGEVYPGWCREGIPTMMYRTWYTHHGVQDLVYPHPCWVWTTRIRAGYGLPASVRVLGYPHPSVYWATRSHLMFHI